MGKAHFVVVDNDDLECDVLDETNQEEKQAEGDEVVGRMEVVVVKQPAKLVIVEHPLA